jgi:hypothetical protein
MDLIPVLFALALPALLGRLLLGLFVPITIEGRAALVWGNGLMAGLLIVPMLMRALNAVGVPLDFLAIASVASSITMLTIMAHIYQGKTPRADSVSPPGLSTLPTTQKVFLTLISILLAARLATIGLELLWRPLFPWDATMHWATKARVWFDAGNIVPFVENKEWLKVGGKDVFTDHHPDYPITIPLLQVWMNSATGYWNESLMNLPWLLCLIALGSAFYGQARASGVGLMIAITFGYFLLSMPLINTHVALAGYADLFLGACYCAALMAFHNWTVERQLWQAGMALFFALSCTLIKNEGFYWLLTFVPALAVVLLPRCKAVILLVLILLTLICLLAFIPADLIIAGHSLKQLNLRYRPEAVAGIARNFWVYGNWHLFGYLLIFLLLASLRKRGIKNTPYLGIITALASALGLFLILFLFTGYAGGAVRSTAVGRISVQLIPGLVFLAMLLTHTLFAPSWKEASTK